MSLYATCYLCAKGAEVVRRQNCKPKAEGRKSRDGVPAYVSVGVSENNDNNANNDTNVNMS